MKSDSVRSFKLVQSPLGTLALIGTEHFVEKLLWKAETTALAGLNGNTSSKVLKEAEGQLLEYFSGDRHLFSVPLAPHGTVFQKQVWRELSKIPFGKTLTYSALASQLGDPNKARAVGSALGKNPIPIFLPCHRILRAHGNLGGFSGGLKIKSFLLSIES